MHHHKIAKHFTPQIDKGQQHPPKALALPSLLAYLLIIVIFGASLYLIRTHAPRILGTVSFTAAQIIDLTNARRAQNGLPALTSNNQLAAAAAAKATDMFAHDYWAHNSPTGRTPWSFITAADYRYLFAGENLARDFADAGSVVAAWMNSPSHRSNLLDGNFKEIGVAVADGKLGGREGILVVQMFGAGIGQVPATQPLAQQPSAALQSPSPAASAPPSPLPVAQVTPPLPTLGQLQPSQAAELTAVTVLASRRFSIAKIASLVLIGIVFGLFALEVVLSIKRSDLRLRPQVIAHLLILGFVLFAVWYAVAGAVI